jgi:hypothetical protein
MVQEFVHSFKWRVVQGEIPALYVLRQEPTGLFTVLTSRSLFRIKGDIEVVISGVSDFQITENYMFASKKEEQKVSEPASRLFLLALLGCGRFCNTFCANFVSHFL